ncbi:hypothetical protein AA106556_1908 [Neokomagataea tanensis NBRC 106556]|uniref:Uncharacterized protein n=1 Tax=Neokomagataea tanensis NBRC 106556 TaxID=1223519 RepID=A0ABQ0QL73_9PROT|nr:hypothetical protein AA106556_1908 [Neokomagataea tanensis NBRC 106556]
MPSCYGNLPHIAVVHNRTRVVNYFDIRKVVAEVMMRSPKVGALISDLGAVIRGENAGDRCNAKFPL